jgi:hypothetical protein
MEYAPPKKKVLQSETDRWLRLSAKVKPFLHGLETYVSSLFSPAITCECESLCYASSYETVALTVPREVLSMVKQKQKVAGDQVALKLQSQERLSAYEVLDRCLVMFRLINAERENMATVVQTKGTVDLAHVVQLQFFYKYYLRLLNHWNYAHPTAGEGIPVSLQRNFLLTLSDKIACGLLGVVVNELDFLRLYLQGLDPTGTLSQQVTQEDRVFEESVSGTVAVTVAVSKEKEVSKGTLSKRAGGTFRRGASPPPLKSEGVVLRETVPSMPVEGAAAAASAPRATPSPTTSSSRLAQSLGSPRLSSSGPVGVGLPARGSVASSSGSLHSSSPTTAVPHVSTPGEKLAVLQNVYTNEQYREQFLEFAATKYAQENVWFLCDIVKLRAAAVEERAALHAQLQAEYLTSSSAREVNLSSKAKRVVLAMTDFEDLTPLELAWKEVEHQVVQNLCGPYLDILRARSGTTRSGTNSATPSPPNSARSGGPSDRFSAAAAVVALSEQQPASGSSSPRQPLSQSLPVSPTMSRSPLQAVSPDSEKLQLEADLFALALDVALVKDRVKSPGRRMSVLNAFGRVSGSVTPPPEEADDKLQRSGGLPRLSRASAAASPAGAVEELVPPPSLPGAAELPLPPKKIMVSSGAGMPTSLFGDMSASPLFTKRREPPPSDATLAELTEAVRQQKGITAIGSVPIPVSRSGSSGRLGKPLPALPRTSAPLVVDEEDDDFDASTSDL